MFLRLFIPAALAVSSTFGLAQGVDFGLQAGLTFPSGDMTHRVGSDSVISLGCQMRFKLRGGSAIVPRIDYVSFTGEDDSWDPLPVKVKMNILSIGLDYNYYFSRRAGEGFYMGGGLGFLQKEDTYTAPNGYAFHPGQDPSTTNNRLFGALGLGYGINKHLNLYGRFQFFGDERQEDTWNYDTGKYEASYSTSTLMTIGIEFHF